MNYIDTDAIIKKGQKIEQLSTDYSILINKLFNRLQNVPYESKEWIGDVSKYYTKIISMDKENFLNFGKNISQYGTYLKKIGTMSEQTIRNVKTREGE